jgi:hypothetical protein
MRRVALALALAGTLSCAKKQTYHTTVELTRVHAFGKDPKAPGMMDIELRYSECPGDARKLIRGDKEFAKCALGLKKGSKVPVDVVSVYNSERGAYRSDIVKIGDCPIKTDPKDEANYEQIEECTDLKMSGGVAGVHCDRTRNPALVAKCPWLKR